MKLFEKDSLGVVIQILGDVIHHFALRRLVSHGFIKLACYQGFSHCLFPPLPQEQSHLLPLHQHRPHHQLVKRVLEAADLWIIDINVLFFFFLLFLLPLALWPGLIILMR